MTNFLLCMVLLCGIIIGLFFGILIGAYLVSRESPREEEDTLEFPPPKPMQNNHIPDDFED